MRTAIVSIHPRHVAKILDGSKRVELRRAIPKRQITSLIIYETAPTSEIVAIADVPEVLIASPDEIWRRFGDLSGCTRVEFDAYYAGRERGCAIVLDRVRRVSMTLVDVGHRVAPQSLVYAR